MHDYLTRADLGMRMELITNLRPPRDAPKHILQSYFKVYDRYANDETVRDEKSSKKFDGPGAGFPYTKIEMRNFIHTHYAYFLKMKNQAPDKRYESPKQWAAYRKSVSKAITAYRNNNGIK